MKVGLLECDHVQEALRFIAGDYRQMFPALFAKVAPDWEFNFYDVCNGHFPDSVDECDVYICTGSKNSVYDDDEWILKLSDFISEIYHSNKIFIGICFGHQMLGKALGGRVQKADTGWCVGVHRFEIFRAEEWMLPFTSHFHLLMMCQDQVLELPTESILLASAAACPHALFRVGNNMLGIQAHPEFSKEYNKALMELRSERIGAVKAAAGIVSLESATDEIQIAGWINKFVEHALK